MTDNTTEIVLIDKDGTKRKLEGEELAEYMNKVYTLEEVEALIECSKEGKEYHFDAKKLFTTIEGMLGTLKVWAIREAERHAAKLKEIGL